MEDATDKEERKREYNRLAQREFRRRRKEHLKNLEDAQKEQHMEQSGEIERLRQQNTDLKRENEALRAQIYGVPVGTQLLQMQLPSGPSTSRSYSISPSITSSHGAGSPPSAMTSDAMSMSSLSLSSTLLPPAMQTYADAVPMQSMPAYSMVHPSGARASSFSSPAPSEFRRARSAVGQSLQPVTKPRGEPSPCVRPASAAQQDPPQYTFYEARAAAIDAFQALFSDPSTLNDTQKHLSALSMLSTSLPRALQPTKAQLSNPHYHSIDLLPSPMLRDRLINAGGDVSRSFLRELERCSSDGGDSGQLTIWGDNPLDEMAWEFSEQIIERWSWLLGPDWWQRANYWRRRRGAAEVPQPRNLAAAW